MHTSHARLRTPPVAQREARDGRHLTNPASNTFALCTEIVIRCLPITRQLLIARQVSNKLQIGRNAQLLDELSTIRQMPLTVSNSRMGKV